MCRTSHVILDEEIRNVSGDAVVSGLLNTTTEAVSQGKAAKSISFRLEKKKKKTSSVPLIPTADLKTS